MMFIIACKPQVILETQILITIINYKSILQLLEINTALVYTWIYL